MADTPILTGAEAKAIRLKLGFTLEQMGHAIGLKGAYVRQNYHAYEAGRRTMTYPIAHLILAMSAGYVPGSVKPPRVKAPT